VLVYFRREVAQMIGSLPHVLSPGPAVRNAPEKGLGSGADKKNQGARLVWLLVIGTIPAVVVGVLFNTQIEERMRVPQVAAIALALGAIVFFVAERTGDKSRSDRSLTMAEAFWLGCAQALALIPGVSRSGATIAAALFMGLRRTDAARFIFLLAIPAILAAAANEGVKMLKAGMDADMASLFVIGIVSSAIVGYVAVRFCIRYFANHSLDLFAWYRLALAGAVVVWLWRA
jgi:undecaprenyl-diphosphatase